MHDDNRKFLVIKRNKFGVMTSIMNCEDIGKVSPSDKKDMIIYELKHEHPIDIDLI